MRMNFIDFVDLLVFVMIFLMNGCVFLINWCGMFKVGEKVRFRFINGFSNMFFDVRIFELKLIVV